MIDVQTESVFPLSEVPSKLPRMRSGKKIHIATIHRWVGRGLRGIKLEVVRIGATRCTSMEALQRFFNALSQADGIVATPNRKAGEIDRALDELGL
jgi:hypothetical protein